MRDRLVDPALGAAGRGGVDHRTESVVGSSGSPTLSALAPATNRSRKASQTSSWMNARWTLMQTWPA